jgi:23S rRNA (adenine2503-C2)-methyltransferase
MTGYDEKKNSIEYLPPMQSSDLPAIQRWLADKGEPAFRAKQIFSWIHEKQVNSFDMMTNLPKSLRDKTCHQVNQSLK